jgi:hypothetical protein
MLSVPTRIAPAAFIRRTSVASVRGRRTIAVDSRPGPGREPLDVEEVLHREGHTGQRPDGLALRPGGVHGRRLAQRASGRDLGEGVDPSIFPADAGKRRLGHGNGAGVACRDGRSDLGGACPGPGRIIHPCSPGHRAGRRRRRAPARRRRDRHPRAPPPCRRRAGETRRRRAESPRRSGDSRSPRLHRCRRPSSRRHSAGWATDGGSIVSPGSRPSSAASRRQRARLPSDRRRRPSA